MPREPVLLEFVFISTNKPYTCCCMELSENVFDYNGMTVRLPYTDTHWAFQRIIRGDVAVVEHVKCKIGIRPPGAYGQV